MRHVISAYVQNVPGVLSHISGMLASRGYNIDSLAVGETEDPKLSRMTFTVVGEKKITEQVEQVIKQLQKIVTVITVEDMTDDKFVERDLMLIRVGALPGARSKVLEMVSIFRAKVVDVASTSMMIEVSGNESKLKGFIEAMAPFGIIELVRSGIIAMKRGQI
ncbi:MAG: acetolactate synthase small subunit [Planctomycetaceae bacterium]|jgi:acetolactate synthase-1/3 small subunit|nr:acetolactate synthase small subunit [Planctomycetaceae bacterium]